MKDIDLKAISIIEKEIKNGAKIYDAYCVVAKLLNLPIYKCNTRYYTNWRFKLSDDVKRIIDSRKTDGQRSLMKRHIDEFVF